jgi:hypothetical protein
VVGKFKGTPQVKVKHLCNTVTIFVDSLGCLIKSLQFLRPTIHVRADYERPRTWLEYERLGMYTELCDSPSAFSLEMVAVFAL